MTPANGPTPSARKVSDELAQRIVDMICDEELPEGYVLPTELEMLEQWGVGRASLREALRILEVQGVVHMRRGPGGGPVVRAPSRRDLARSASLHLQLHRATYADLVEARLAIEPVMARLAAERGAPVVAALEEINLRFDPEPGPATVELFQSFHQALEDLSHNSVLGLLAGSLREISRLQTSTWDPLKHKLMTPEGSRSTQREHERITAAIAKGDGARAERL